MDDINVKGEGLLENKMNDIIVKQEQQKYLDAQMECNFFP